MNKDLKEFFPWIVFLIVLALVAFGINRYNKVEEKENFQFQVEQCMKISKKSYYECKEIVYASE